MKSLHLLYFCVHRYLWRSNVYWSAQIGKNNPLLPGVFGVACFKASGWFKREKVQWQPELEMKAREIPAFSLMYSLLYQQDSYVTKWCCSLSILCHKKLASNSPLPTSLLAAYSHLSNVPVTDTGPGDRELSRQEWVDFVVWFTIRLPQVRGNYSDGKGQGWWGHLLEQQCLGDFLLSAGGGRVWEWSCVPVRDSISLQCERNQGADYKEGQRY